MQNYENFLNIENITDWVNHGWMGAGNKWNFRQGLFTIAAELKIYTILFLKCEIIVLSRMKDLLEILQMRPPYFVISGTENLTKKIIQNNGPKLYI